MHHGEYVNGELSGRGVTFFTGDIVTIVVDKAEGILSYYVASNFIPFNVVSFFFYLLFILSSIHLSCLSFSFMIQINQTLSVRVVIEEVKVAPMVYIGVTMYNDMAAMRLLDDAPPPISS